MNVQELFRIARNAKSVGVLEVVNAAFAALFSEVQRETQRVVQSGSGEGDEPHIWFELYTRDTYGTSLRERDHDYISICTRREALVVPARILSPEAKETALVSIFHTGSIERRGREEPKRFLDPDFADLSAETTKKMKQCLVIAAGGQRKLFERCWEIISLDPPALRTILEFAPLKRSFNSKQKCNGECGDLVNSGWSFPDETDICCEKCGQTYELRLRQLRDKKK